MATVLMQIYGASDSLWIGDAYADTKKVRRVNQPHAVIYGTSVPDSFWGSLTAENVSDKLLDRIMPFESADGYVDAVQPQQIEPPPELIESIRSWLAFAPGGNLSTENPQPFVVPYSDAARERFDDHMAAICDRRKHEDQQTAALWSQIMPLDRLAPWPLRTLDHSHQSLQGASLIEGVTQSAECECGTARCRDVYAHPSVPSF